jgi:hypothetical protein
MFQLLCTYHVVGTYNIAVTNDGIPILMEGRPAPDFEGVEWKTHYIYWEGSPDKPTSSESVLDAVTRAFMEAGIDAGYVAAVTAPRPVS